jgi:Ni/Co efflux regulator RcnB
MKKVLVAALAAATALSGIVPAGVASAQPGWQDHDRDRDHDGVPDRAERSVPPGWQGHDRDHDGVPDRVERWDRRQWEHDRDRWVKSGYRYYGGRHGYAGYNGRWRTGERYPYWRDHRYVIEDWRAYRLAAPPPGYRYYRDDSGDIVMAAIASGVIGLIVGSSLHD